MLKKLLNFVGYLAITATLGFVIYYYALNPNSPLKSANTDYSGLSTQALFTTKFPNENAAILDFNQYKGKIIVLNFWASWCPPCREEMPELDALHKKYQPLNVAVIGIAAEELATMRQFVVNSPVSYPTIAGDMEAMSLASLLGNSQGGLPYTVIINPNSKVTNIYLGRLDMKKVERDLNALLQSDKSNKQ
jgi:thiol-disulfide isomerase/thioredoxin